MERKNKKTVKFSDDWNEEEQNTKQPEKIIKKHLKCLTKIVRMDNDLEALKLLESLREKIQKSFENEPNLKNRLLAKCFF